MQKLDIQTPLGGDISPLIWIWSHLIGKQAI